MLVQQIAKDVPPEELQIVSYHPGGIFTELAEHAGFKKDDPRWDDGKLNCTTVKIDWLYVMDTNTIQKTCPGSSPCGLRLQRQGSCMGDLYGQSGM